MVRAKFQCNGVTPTPDYRGGTTGYVVNLSAVYNNKDGKQNEENKKFWEMTPSGTISLYTVNENAANEFGQGKYYYVDFTETD